LTAPREESGGSTGYTAPGDRELVLLGCCQNDWGKARNFIGRGSETEKNKHGELQENMCSYVIMQT
jgi:hypothetical protein